MKTYTITIEEDENGDAILPVPYEALQELGWEEGTILDFDIKVDPAGNVVIIYPVA